MFEISNFDKRRKRCNHICLQNEKYIIHTVGPDFRQTPTAFLELFNAYYNSLVLLKENNLHSISFPLISSGIFTGNIPNPAEESAKLFSRAYRKFIQNFPNYDIDVLLCAFTSKEYNAAKTVIPQR